MMEVKYTGSGYVGSAVAMNKKITKQIFCRTESARLPAKSTLKKIMA
jgi:D-alanine-D-alanine ligase-like ATP-grasp enzyme